MSVKSLAESIIGGPLSDWRDMTGGCIHRVQSASLNTRARVVIKSGASSAASLFEEEAYSLEMIAGTATLPVPRVLGFSHDDDNAVLVLEYLPPARANPDTWSRFADLLAEFHLHEINSNTDEIYGFSRDNHLGSTLQVNTFCDDWVEFNALYRLGFQVRLNRDRGRLSRSDARLLEKLINRLDTLIPRNPRPSLLHGDLWSGNAHCTANAENTAEIALLDPACYIGDAIADIAMMQLFGGFPESVYEIHAELLPDAAALYRERIDVYQLYHLLNHLFIFGSGYHHRVMSLARKYTG